MFTEPPSFRPRKRPAVTAAIVIASVILVSVIGGLAWMGNRWYSDLVPTHKGFGREHAFSVGGGWYSESISTLHLGLEVPGLLHLYPRSILHRTYPWIDSYVSYHGGSEKVRVVVGGLWMNPQSTHYSAKIMAGSDQESLFANRKYTVKSAKLDETVVANQRAVTLTLKYTWRNVDYTRRCLYFEFRGCVVYLLEAYPDSIAKAGKDGWNRIQRTLVFDKV